MNSESAVNSEGLAVTLTPSSPKTDDRWSKWWFVMGGGLHRAWKYHKYSDLNKLANYLPKAAWDEQQKEVERLEKDRDSWKARALASELVCEAATECDEYLCDPEHFPLSGIGARSQLHLKLASALADWRATREGNA